MIFALLDHLWQSTLCVGVAAILVLLLRRRSARVRYWLWFGASTKFLLPLVFLVDFGRLLTPAQAFPQIQDSFRWSALLVSQGMATPFALAPPSASEQTGSWQALILAIWGIGVLLAVSSWAVRWRRMRLLVKASTPLPIDAPLLVCSSAGLLEPALIGIVKPVFLLPTGMLEQLVPEELQSILAHELCHLRRRDNLTYAIHLLTRTVFWFYPLLWWLGWRLIAERERACDEAALAAGHAPMVYCDTILKVCRHYMAAPAVGAAAGVSGGDLQSRIQRIMTWRETTALNTGEKSVLIGVLVVLVAAPALLGACTSRAISETTMSVNAPTAAERARLLYEQTRPQKEVTFNPADFGKFVGYYQSRDFPDVFANIFQIGDHYYSQLTGQLRVEFFPESSKEFFATVVPAQISFVTDPEGRSTEMILHQNGFLRQWSRASKAVFEAAAAKRKQRIDNNVPDRGTEASLRRFIEAEQKGQPNYDEMTPQVAAENRAEQPGNMQLMQRLGALQSLTFRGIDPVGRDTFDATFSKARAVFTIGPLTVDGKVAIRGWRVVK